MTSSPQDPRAMPLAMPLAMPRAMPEVAVVIPCYGYARYLPEAVASVLGQTWRNIDCVIVDPESPDDTSDVARQLIAANSDPGRRLRLLCQDNRGLSASRNEGIVNTSAPLLLPLDADDLLEPRALELMVGAFLANPEVSVVHCSGREFGDSSEAMPVVQVTEQTQLHKNRLPYCSMFTRQAFEQVGGYNENMRHGYEDWDFWVGMLERGLRFHALPIELFRYRKHGRTMIDEALARDIWLRARLILNHETIYRPEHVSLAKDILELGDRQPGAALRFRITCFYTEVNCPEFALPHARDLLAQHGAGLAEAGRAYLHFAVGYGLLALDRAAEAVVPLAEAATLAPHNATYASALALAQFHSGQPENASASLSTALRLDPHHPEARELQKRFGAPIG